jgi:hypothetical protein
MSTNQLRALLSLVNVALIAMIALLGVRTFRGSPPGPGESPPADFNPILYQVQSEGGQHSSVDEHRVTWQQLDRPLPPPPPPTPVQQAPTGPPTPQDLSRLYTLVMASFNPSDPALSSFIIQGRDGQQRSFSVGDSFDGYQVMEIDINGDGDAREAVVTVQSGTGTRDTIRLRRANAP